MLIQSFWALAAAASFSSMAAFVKLSNSTFGPIELVFYRSLFTMIAMLIVVRINGYSLKTEHLSGHLIRDILGLISTVVWFFTLGKLALGTNITLTYTTSLFLSANFIILAFIRHKPIPWGPILAILVGFLGIATILQPTFHDGDEIPALLCLCVACLDLGIYWQVRRLGSWGEPSWRIVFYFSFFSTIATLAAVYIFEDGLHIPDVTSGICLLAIGALATLGLISATRAWVGGNMLLVSCLGFSAIPFSEAISIFAFDNIPGPYTVIGMLLILIAGLAATIFTKRAEEAEKKIAKNQ